MIAGILTSTLAVLFKASGSPWSAAATAAVVVRVDPPVPASTVADICKRTLPVAARDPMVQIPVPSL